MKGELATLEPLPNFPNGVEESIMWRWMSCTVEKKSATILVVIALCNTALLKGRGTGFPLHFSAGGSMLGSWCCPLWLSWLLCQLLHFWLCLCGLGPADVEVWEVVLFQNFVE